jgi:hypothetical protein
VEPAFFTPEAVAALVDKTRIAPALAAGETQYQSRLKACAVCDALREKVLCAHCGCFVQFRARTAKSYCPNPTGDKWTLFQLQHKELS